MHHLTHQPLSQYHQQNNQSHNGLLHTQFISDNNRFWLIETMRRCPGDLYGTLIKKSTGFDYAKFYSKPFLNQKNSIDEVNLLNRYFARHTISSPKDLIFKSIKYKNSTCFI